MFNGGAATNVNCAAPPFFVFIYSHFLYIGGKYRLKVSGYVKWNEGGDIQWNGCETGDIPGCIYKKTARHIHIYLTVHWFYLKNLMLK